MTGVSEFIQQEAERKRRRAAFWDELAPMRDQWRRRGGGYHQEVLKLLKALIPKGSRVLEIGSATGDILGNLGASHGVGVDLSLRMVEIARAKYPRLSFLQGDVEELPQELLDESFDFIVMSDVVGHLDDVWKALREVRGVAKDHTRLILTWYNFLWEPLLKLGEKVRLKMPVPDENWLSLHDLQGFLHLNHFEVVSSGSRALFPKKIPLFSWLLNTFLSPLPLLRSFNFVQYLVARPTPVPEAKKLSASVLVPCRNEKGNIRPAIERMPVLGPTMEVLFCDGHSTDGTVQEIEAVMSDSTRPFTIRLLHQEGTGKNDAMRLLFDAAKNDVLCILDSDLTVPPEDLPKFLLAIAEGRGEMINGTRLVYPMEEGAMRLLNIVGNKFFSLVLSWLLGQTIKDTLCGTKVFTRETHRQIKETRDSFGGLDPFCDFDLIFGAALHHLKIRDLPVRYRARTYGDIKIRRFRDGLLLLRMSLVALRRLKLRR